jgi:hypothetical protein
MTKAISTFLSDVRANPNTVNVVFISVFGYLALRDLLKSHHSVNFSKGDYSVSIVTNEQLITAMPESSN